MRYIFDSNSFITPYRNYYPMDVVPTFWKKLEEKINQGNVCTIDKVKKEILRGDDDLSKWFKKFFKNPVKFPGSSNDVLFKFGENENEIKHYIEILNLVEKSNHYKPEAI